MKIGFIGLGNVGGKLAGSLLRNGFQLTVRDLDRATAAPFLDGGAEWADSPRAGPAGLGSPTDCSERLVQASIICILVAGVYLPALNNKKTLPRHCLS